MTYFIKLGEDAWIEVGAFAFSAESPAVLNKSNGLFQPGPAEFGTVNVELTSDALLPFLIKHSVSVAQDVIIRATNFNEITGRQATYDMVLSDAVVTQFNENFANGPSLQLAFSEIAITTYTTDSNQVSLPDGTFDWDVKDNDGTPENLPAIPDIEDLENVTPGVLPAKYVMAIGGVGGSSDLEDYEGWFDITDFSYSTGRTFDANLGKFVVNENVGFSVTVADQTALTALLNLAANDKLISAVQIDGLSSANLQVAQTLFGTVKIDSISEDGANGYDVNFVATQIKSEVFANDKGTLGSDFDFDFTTRKEAIITAPTPGSSLETSAPVEYFLALSGLAGDSVIVGQERFFRLDDVSFAVGATGATLDMSNVNVTLSSDTEIADILARVITGKEFTGATVNGIDGKGNVVYTLDMGDVSIQSLEDSSGGGISLELDFHEVEISSKGYDANGVLKANPSFAWNFDTDTALGKVASATPAGKVATTTVAPEKFYMLVDGMNGGSTDPAHLRWFELTDFGIQAFRDGTTPEFSTVQTALGSDVALTAMMKAAITGSAIKGIRIEGVVDVGGIETKVYELALTDVRVESVQDFTGPGYQANFDFGKFALRTYDGLTGAVSGVTGWDRVNDISYTSRPAIGSSKGRIEAPASEFYFTATDIPGDIELKIAPGTSGIVDYSFDVFQPTLEGANQGDSELGRLTLTFATDTALPDFLVYAGNGKAVEAASLLGLGNTDGKLSKVFTIDLNGGLVTAVNDFAGAGFTVEIDFKKFQITQQTFNPLTGKLGAVNSFGWDDVLNKTTEEVTGKTSGTKKQFVSPTSQFMAIDGVHGDLTGVTRGGWLDISEFTFGGVNTGERGLGDGDGAGKFDLASITVSVETDSGLTALLDYMTKGTPITGIQIEGTALNLNDVEKTVQIHTLGKVYVSSVTDVSGPGYSVTFEAARYSLEQFFFNGKTAGQAVFDVEANVAQGANVSIGPGGSTGNDVLAGNRTSNTIDGLSGNDTIYGYDGDDTLRGSSGNDTLLGGNGNDTLTGGTEDDILIGGAGKDVLTGNEDGFDPGLDIFKFNAASDSTPDINRDIITDFDFDFDRIDLSAVSSAVLIFIPGGGVISEINQVRVVAAPNNPGADSIVQVNLSGDSAPEMEIYIMNHVFSDLLNIDFIL